MNKTAGEAVSFIKELKRLLKNEKNAEVVICPSFTSLSAAADEIKGSSIGLGAQNMYFEGAGAYTGEISPLMLNGLGCEYVILGHSERREFFGEDDFLANRKVIAALNHSIKPILCIGESLEQRKNGKTKEVVENQLKNCLKGMAKESAVKVCIAYEPIWAISRGNPNRKAATSQDAEENHSFIRGVLSSIFGGSTAKNIRIIYGGSVKPENAKELLSMPNIDGALVGNASLDAKSFAEIVKAVK